ncbi:MAG: hypothetical protein ACYCSF_08725 [Acidimicrobiales bacterium]
MPEPLTTQEIGDLAASIRAVLDDCNVLIISSSRHRWEGALAAIEFVLGETARLALGGHGRSVACRHNVPPSWGCPTPK